MPATSKTRAEQFKEIDRLLPLHRKRKKPKKKPSPEPAIKPLPQQPQQPIDLSQFKTEQQQSAEHALAEITTTLKDLELISMHTDLSEQQIIDLVALDIEADIYNDRQICGRVIDLLEPKMVSKNRKGRTEILEAIKNLAGPSQQQQGFFGRIGSGMRGLF